MRPTLFQVAAEHDNDYTHLEQHYRHITGDELVIDPYRSPARPHDITLSVSVIIPAWQSHDTLVPCLTAVAYNTFNRRYPDALEVIVVDDGSTDGTWALLQSLRLAVNLKALRISHHSAAHARNTALAVADGDIVIFCDSDVLLSPFAIEELAKRHQMLDNVLLVGFRQDIHRNDPRLHSMTLAGNLASMRPRFQADMRVNHGGGGWPESMTRDSQHFKALGCDRPLIMSDDTRWDLPSMVFGTLFSLLRRDLEAIGGFDERFYGWGREDTFFGVRAVAMQCFIVPVYAACGYHIAHHNRSNNKARELTHNSRVYRRLLHTPYDDVTVDWLPDAKHRIQAYFERRGHEHIEMDDNLLQVHADDVSDLVRRGQYLYQLGCYDEAVAAYDELQDDDEAGAWTLFDRGKALRSAGRIDEAIAALDGACHRLVDSPWPHLELAQALASHGRFAEATRQLRQAQVLAPDNRLVRFMSERPLAKFLRRAQHCEQAGWPDLALRDYEALLIRDPQHEAALAARERLLSERQSLAESYAS